MPSTGLPQSHCQLMLYIEVIQVIAYILYERPLFALGVDGGRLIPDLQATIWVRYRYATVYMLRADLSESKICVFLEIFRPRLCCKARAHSFRPIVICFAIGFMTDSVEHTESQYRRHNFVKRTSPSPPELVSLDESHLEHGGTSVYE